MKALIKERIDLGSFVKITNEAHIALGIGQVTAISGNLVRVTYFDVPGELVPYQIDTPISTLRTVDLPEQTRVFLHDEATDKWQVGRIVDGKGDICVVAFPNQQLVNVPRSELRVRWRKPIADPLEFLARYITETPRFAEARSGFMRAVTEQRAASRSMSAVLSASVQLVDYQFNVVQRVLQDPVQRYLLADEVGLGKTVEAGLLVRQYLLDSPDASVLLVVPAALVTQWRQELTQRFGLADWLDDFVFVVPSDNVSRIERHISTVGMLVVDEAHHLSRETSEGAHPLYGLLRDHAPRIPRLLLLSATPVLSDTAGFLRILHLLDPVVFPLDDQVGFDRRLQSRQLVAELAALLVPQNVLSMEDDLDRLQEAFHDDSTLMMRIEKLRPIVQSLPDEDDEGLIAAINELRAHLTETYKLHRRILRNRRKAVPWATPQRSGVELLQYASIRRRERCDALDELRVHLLNANLIAPVAQVLFAAAVHPTGAPSIEAALKAARIDDTRASELARHVDALAKQNIEEERQRATVAARECALSEHNNPELWARESARAADLTRSLAWLLAQDVYRLRFSDAQSLELKQIANGDLRLMQNDTRKNGLQFWANFLGFVRQPGGGDVDPTLAVRETLSACIAQGEEMPATEFIERLAQRLPVLDGGVYRVAVESRLERDALLPLQSGQLSTSLSRAIFSLMIDQTLQFENKADVGHSIVLTGRDGLRADHRYSWVRLPLRAK